MNFAAPSPGSDEPEFAQSAEATAAATDAIALKTCWRCGKDIPTHWQRCLHCDAPFNIQPISQRRRNADPLDRDAQSLIRLLVIFGLMLGTSIIAGVWHRLAGESVTPRSTEMLIVVLIFEGVDTAMIVIAWIIAAGRYREQSPSITRQVSSWIISLPLLAAILGFNVLYHYFLTSWLKLDVAQPDVIADNTMLMLWSLAICFQPAVMEELFFRYLMFGSLRKVLGGHSVVWITAVMFALAHVGAPLSLLVLFVLGVFLGYARLASGSIFLPMFLHFFHNACVMALEGDFVGLF
ncbi:MAG: CPBP family intramembrane metalloprotease [Pirellulales bacterium]|nr:CPBP family intramembrane metalloprotease [Pirellulales bacterium]